MAYLEYAVYIHICSCTVGMQLSDMSVSNPLFTPFIINMVFFQNVLKEIIDMKQLLDKHMHSTSFIR